MLALLVFPCALSGRPAFLMQIRRIWPVPHFLIGCLDGGRSGSPDQVIHTWGFILLTWFNGSCLEHRLFQKGRLSQEPWKHGVLTMRLSRALGHTGRHTENSNRASDYVRSASGCIIITSNPVGANIILVQPHDVAPPRRVSWYTRCFDHHITTHQLSAMLPQPLEAGSET